MYFEQCSVLPLSWSIPVLVNWLDLVLLDGVSQHLDLILIWWSLNWLLHFLSDLIHSVILSLILTLGNVWWNMLLVSVGSLVNLMLSFILNGVVGIVLVELSLVNLPDDSADLLNRLFSKRLAPAVR